MSELYEHVLNWAVESGNRDEVLKDLLRCGCRSGMVSHLCYYSDTTKFYKKHKNEINTLLADSLEKWNLSIVELFGEKWDAADPLALGMYNQTCLAWFGFEETARKILYGLEGG